MTRTGPDIPARRQARRRPGAEGLGEPKAGLPVDDRRMMALDEAGEDLRLPVLSRCDGLRGTEAPGLPGPGRELAAFPEVDVIGHGPGFWASISDAVGAGDPGG